jgi:hypothetical protein
MRGLDSDDEVRNNLKFWTQMGAQLLSLSNVLGVLEATGLSFIWVL